jgi:hypothetical protein
MYDLTRSRGHLSSDELAAMGSLHTHEQVVWSIRLLVDGCIGLEMMNYVVRDESELLNDPIVVDGTFQAGDGGMAPICHRCMTLELWHIIHRCRSDHRLISW